MRYAPAVLFVFGIGGAIGMLGWVAAGRPEQYMWSAFACGIATTATFMAGALWRLRAALRAAWLGPVEEADRVDVYDTDRPSFDATPGTAAERSADLRRCYLGYITIDDYLDRWVGRPLVEDKARDAVDAMDRMMLEHEIRVKIIGEILAELRRSDAPDAGPACTHCLGIHDPATCPVKAGTEDPVSGVTPYAAAEARANGGVNYIVPGGFSVGDMVRLRRDDRIVKLKSVYGDGRIWTVEFGGSQDRADERDFVIALPKAGELWNSKECYVCMMAWKHKWPECLTNVSVDWPDAPATRARISCGCLYRIGSQG